MIPRVYFIKGLGYDTFSGHAFMLPKESKSTCSVTELMEVIFMDHSKPLSCDVQLFYLDPVFNKVYYCYYD